MKNLFKFAFRKVNDTKVENLKSLVFVKYLFEQGLNDRCIEKITGEDIVTIKIFRETFESGTLNPKMDLEDLFD